MEADVIRAIVFDLDGTLYSSRELGWEIHRAACRYIAEVRGIVLEEADALIRATQGRLAESIGHGVSLTLTCTELGGEIRELHRRFSDEIVPEEFLGRDDRVVKLLERLGTGFGLYVYTNNNLSLSTRIMRLLGVEGLFQRVFTIEDSWQPKPDRGVLASMLREIGRRPGECLFVGDRYDIDLRFPAEMGARVFFTTSVEDLLTLDTMTWRCP